MDRNWNEQYWFSTLVCPLLKLKSSQTIHVIDKVPSEHSCATKYYKKTNVKYVDSAWYLYVTVDENNSNLIKHAYMVI